MSWQATSVIDSLPHDGSISYLSFRVLLKLANEANAQGRNAWAFKGVLGNELGVHPRSIQRALAELEGLHLIRRGDQRSVSHFRGGNRPTVWDINMTDHVDGTPEMWPPDRGETELSTASWEETREETTAVTQKNEGTTYIQVTDATTEAMSPPARCRESMTGRHKRDAQGYCLLCGHLEQVPA